MGGRVWETKEFPNFNPQARLRPTEGNPLTRAAWASSPRSGRPAAGDCEAKPCRRIHTLSTSLKWQSHFNDRLKTLSSA